MPYKDPEKQREYLRRWIAERRAAWFADKSCTWPVDAGLCGSTEDLQLDHIDPSQKISHRIWSWSEERRKAELAKCRVLCRPHHDEKSRTERAKGEQNGNARLSETDILIMRWSGMPTDELSSFFQISRRHTQQILHRDKWKHV